ncbi:STAS/SEC14 domain-containing protein [Rhizobium sp. C1]|uniref:STAS/SEC14 domain-containing protein n=1 Tax=Rhizobium sp. C1 TaxID=1349799 RepID=UPI001E57F4C8|nr:STAS/SEC14 domain-containing protein [Rhizobium sp. C1]MCD2180116.1 STAS/SEC14 domain-containing protein [Rhizobium sp. C1]
MFTLLTDLPSAVLGFEARGKFTAADYETVLMPAMDAAIKNGPVNLLFVLPEGFHGMELKALRDDLAFGLKHFHDFRKFAFVTDDEAMAALTRNFAFMIPAEMQVFAMAERDRAVSWLQA